MIEIHKKEECAGCSACASICPKKCIKIVEDAEGFDYPKIDLEKCVNCHLCEIICPIKNNQDFPSKTYTLCVQNKNEIIRSCSSAGGVIGAIYQAVFAQNGIVYGVGYDKENIARFMDAESLDDCFKKKLFASKYVSAELDGIFLKVKEEVEIGRLVCFVGLPCQVAGLCSMLNKGYDNLWVIDLTCYGVPSRKLYRKYIEYLEAKYNEKITDVRFRDKMFGYAAPTMTIEFASGKIKSQNCDVKSYLRCFFKDISSRPSCYKCHFKTVDRVSDLTVGDMRSIHKFVEIMDDDLGTTVLYVHNKKGQKIVNSINKYVVTAKILIEDVLSTSGKKMISCPQVNPRREEFFSEIDNLPYIKLTDKYCPPDLSEYLSNVIKSLLKVTGLYKTGVLKALKRR